MKDISIPLVLAAVLLVSACHRGPEPVPPHFPPVKIRINNIHFADSNIEVWGEANKEPSQMLWFEPAGEDLSGLLAVPEGKSVWKITLFGGKVYFFSLPKRHDKYNLEFGFGVSGTIEPKIVGDEAITYSPEPIGWDN